MNGKKYGSPKTVGSIHMQNLRKYDDSEEDGEDIT
jgi:hypothetical protein